VLLVVGEFETADVLAVCVKAAVRAFVPTGSAEVVQVATPALAVTALQPEIDVPPFLKFTVPEVAAAGVVVAVSVTLVP